MLLISPFKDKSIKTLVGVLDWPFGRIVRPIYQFPMFFRLNMTKGGGGGGGDNLADFFDFSKPWVRRERMVPSAPRMVEVDPLSIPPPATSEEEKAAETEAQWQKYQVFFRS